MDVKLRPLLGRLVGKLAGLPAGARVHSETFFLYAKKNCLAAAATLPVSRALERAVVSPR